MKLTLPFPPLGNRYYRVWRGRAVLSPEGRAYKATVAHECRDCEPMEGNVQVEITAYRPRKAGDIDSVTKCALDSLQGVAYLNDKQIVDLLVHRRDDKHNPRLEVEVVQA